MKKVIIFTDGACRGNPGIGGWGALLRSGKHEKSISGGEHETTNNRMELTAAIKALSVVKEKCFIECYTDSQYVQKGITQWMPVWKKRHWKKADNKPVKNADLWEALDKQAMRHQVTWHWVKGHSGHEGNNRADALANHAIDILQKKGKS